MSLFVIHNKKKKENRLNFYLNNGIFFLLSFIKVNHINKIDNKIVILLQRGDDQEESL